MKNYTYNQDQDIQAYNNFFMEHDKEKDNFKNRRANMKRDKVKRLNRNSKWN